MQFFEFSPKKITALGFAVHRRPGGMPLGMGWGTEKIAVRSVDRTVLPRMTLILPPIELNRSTQNTIIMQQDVNRAVLQAAFNAWSAAATLRKSRRRNKRWAYGDQWGDTSVDAQGNVVTDWQRYSANGAQPVTNNLIRNLVRSVVGRYRKQVIDAEEDTSQVLAQVARDNQLDELDSRILEEFLLSGCCVQRVDVAPAADGGGIVVENVNPNRFLVNAMTDVRSWDCEIVGQLHDMSIARLLQRVARGSRRKAQWIRRLYTDNAQARSQAFAQSIGADSQSASSFWHSDQPGKCRAIEVWTLESREVAVRHNRLTGQVAVESPASRQRHDDRGDVHWDIATTWHCRWFSPMGDLLAEWDSPYGHRRHPYVMRFYPLTDGEVHSFVEGVIDQQKHVNRMVTMMDQIMASCAKGVLLYPETALPDGFTWADVRRVWSSTGGILPYSPHMGTEKPEQIVSNATDVGGYEMLKLQMQLLEEVSGVSGALQGKAPAGMTSAGLYQAQVDNASIAMADIYGTFTNFRRQRDDIVMRMN